MSMQVTEEVWDQCVDRAEAEWEVVVDAMTLEGVRYVQAECAMTRYSVVVAEMPYPAALSEGAATLVAVLSPVRAAYPLQRGGGLHVRYVLEKFGPMGAMDLAAVTKTIAYALDRQAVLK